MQNQNFNTEFQEKNVKAQSWLDLFKLTIKKAQELTHCATLAWYEDIEEPYSAEKGYGIASFKPFPLTTKQSEYILRAYFFKEETTFKKNVPYCIIFMDYNFVSCLNSGNITKTNDTDIHSLSYGVVIETK